VASLPKFIKIERSDTAGSYIEELKDIPQMIDGEFDDIEYLASGTQMILTIVEMSQEEYEALPEFDGW
jgi:hypothetical protein